MKPKQYAILLITIIGAVSIIGFLGMGLLNHTDSNLCPFAMGSEQACPTNSSSIVLAIHHFSGIQQLGQVSMGDIGVLMLLLSLLMIVAARTFERSIFKKPTVWMERKNREVFIPFIQQFLFWLSLHNKTDPHVLVTVRSEP